jgi:hypothetical protein
MELFILGFVAGLFISLFLRRDLDAEEYQAFLLRRNLSLSAELDQAEQKIARLEDDIEHGETWKY